MTDLELLRFATKSGITVIGGLEKILDQVEFNNLVMYADRRYSLSPEQGFDLVSQTPPRCFFTKNFVDLETMVTDSDGYDRIWDCGEQVCAMKRNLDN